jgi:hypothetical protein
LQRAGEDVRVVCGFYHGDGGGEVVIWETGVGFLGGAGRDHYGVRVTGHNVIKVVMPEAGRESRLNGGKGSSLLGDTCDDDGLGYAVGGANKALGVRLSSVVEFYDRVG